MAMRCDWLSGEVQQVTLDLHIWPKIHSTEDGAGPLEVQKAFELAKLMSRASA